MNQHFVEPDYFLVSFWPGTTPEDNIQTIKTDSKFPFVLTFIDEYYRNTDTLIQLFF